MLLLYLKRKDSENAITACRRSCTEGIRNQIIEETLRSKE